MSAFGLSSLTASERAWLADALALVALAVMAGILWIVTP